MKVYEIIEGTEVNGPGYRLCIWFQGCSRNCPGCFNPQAQKTDGGRDVGVSDVLKLLEKQKYDGLSVSGGEPFEQSDELLKLLKAVKKKEYGTLVFSGFTYEQLSETHPDVLKFCDYLIDGPYMKDIKSRCRYAGSGNQRFLKLKDGQIDEDLTCRDEYCEDSEIIIKNGEIVVTGFSDFPLL